LLSIASIFGIEELTGQAYNVSADTFRIHHSQIAERICMT